MHEAASSAGGVIYRRLFGELEDRLSAGTGPLYFLTGRRNGIYIWAAKFSRSSKQADASLMNSKSKWPVVVLEIGISETTRKLYKDAERWLEGSNSQTKLVILADVQETPKWETSNNKWELSEVDFRETSHDRLSDHILHPRRGPVFIRQLLPDYQYCAQLTIPPATPTDYNHNLIHDSQWTSNQRGVEWRTLPVANSDFYTWNPALNDDCPSLYPGYYVCVGIITITTTTISTTSAGQTPTPAQTGMVSGCTDFYLVNTNDGCYDIAAAEESPWPELYAWNPALNGDCSGLWLNYYTSIWNSTLSQ
ncbi:muramidase, putative [Talaromyces stipitatus ATCC 10500]|uniref:Muramidase, putative n=1 Tax=Talaromyces stipitatus (strain ATCC 10500 / CBS 375.48 / QM 6759 / NRRL 1006) TaxID=441959 RepID=B8MJM2_TALSN|nr:muramidase, putative [Talaromyces stipitatus ATCC 10500]EED15222.1 muramidase, putative [Talaromyces stipitatus ATCC 10500]